MRTLYLFVWRLLLTAFVTFAGIPPGRGAETGAVASAAGRPAEIVDVKMIWDRGEHNAFTDLIRWKGQWWCTFRESAAHVGGDGIIRVLVSKDGTTWDSAATLAEKDVDLRDPKFSVTPDDRLMLVCGGSIYLGTKQLKGRRPRVSFSPDGKTWTAPQLVLAEGDWLWRVTWHDGTAYGVSYRTTKTAAGSGEEAVLFKSPDGLAWSEVTKFAVTDRPNETTLRFARDGRMVALVRRETGDTLGWWGEARAPYTAWTWRPTNMRLGGPDFMELPDGRVIVGTRRYPPAGTKGKYTMEIGQVAKDGTSIEPLVTLPSGGDTSYPRLVWQDGLLWVSYYSSHEAKSKIYLAKVRL
jgi:hypothetical protein